MTRKKTKKKRTQTKATGNVPVQLYMPSTVLKSFDADAKTRQRELKDLTGDVHRISRSHHGTSVVKNYLRARSLDPNVTYQEFWERVEQALTKATKRKAKR